MGDALATLVGLTGVGFIFGAGLTAILLLLEKYGGEVVDFVSQTPLLVGGMMGALMFAFLAILIILDS